MTSEAVGGNFSDGFESAASGYAFNWWGQAAAVVARVVAVATPALTRMAQRLNKIDRQSDKLDSAADVTNKTPRKPTAQQREDALKRSQSADGVETCTYCNQPLDRRAGNPNSAEIDHRKAYSRGGETVDENLDASCRTCNRSKGAKELGSEWIAPNER